MEEIKKILVMGKNGYYCFAKKDKDGLNLKPDNESPLINARGLVPYGLIFEFGGGLTPTDFGIFCYRHINYTLEESQGRLKSHEDYGRVNLDRTIKGLEKTIVDKGADYVLVSNLKSLDMQSFWYIAGKAQLLLKLTPFNKDNKFKVS